MAALYPIASMYHVDNSCRFLSVGWRLIAGFFGRQVTSSSTFKATKGTPNDATKRSTDYDIFLLSASREITN